jgi:hypothetical protein
LEDNCELGLKSVRPALLFACHGVAAVFSYQNGGREGGRKEERDREREEREGGRERGGERGRDSTLLRDLV